MPMTLLSITVCFAHFLITPALYFNTLPANTQSDYAETTPTTSTTTNQQPEILTTATPSPPRNTTTTLDITTDSPEANTQLNITPVVTFAQETTSLHQHNSSLSQNDVMGDGVIISNASDATMSHRNTLNNPTTVSTNLATHEDDKNETGTTSSLSYNENGQTVQTPHPFSRISTASWTEGEDETTKSGNYETNSTQATFANMNIAYIDDKNETGTMSNVSYNEDGHTVQTPGPLNSASTASWKEEEHEMTQSDEGNYETNSTQAIFANVNIARQTPHIDVKNESGTMSNVSYSEDAHTVLAPGPLNSASTASWKKEEDETTQSDEGNYETNSTQAAFANMNIAKVTPHTNVKNETGTISNLNYSEDGHTVQTPFNTAPWNDGETTKTDGDYETNSTQATFANTNEWTGTAVEGSYNFTSEHGEDHYERTVKAFNLSAATATERNNWPTLQTTDIPMITPTQDPTVSNEPGLHTSTDGGNQSTTPQNIYRFTSSVAQTENITGTGTPRATTYTTNSITSSVLTDNSTNATTNTTDTESKGWPTCFNSDSQSRKSKLVCFITIWTLAMTATMFLGISIFLWVRLSVFKKKMKEKGRHAGNKESLWADPKATVQERVEFWYVNGSTLEADRKEKDRKRREKVKRRGQEQDTEENELWIQPRVTVGDIAEFWYANRRRNETTGDMY